MSIKRLSYAGFRVEAERILTKLKAYIDTFLTQINNAKGDALTDISNERSSAISALQSVQADVESNLRDSGEISIADINRIWEDEQPTSQVVKEFLGKDGLAEVRDLIMASALDKLKYVTGDHSAVAWGTKIQYNSTPANNKVGNRAAWNTFRSKIGCYWMMNNGKALKLDSSDKTLTIDGETVNHATYGGHIMVRIPAHYEKTCWNFEYGCNVQWCSEEEFEGATLIPERWIAAHLAGLSGTTLVGRAGYTPANTKTITQFQTYAQNNGTNWGIVSYMDRKVLRDLALWEYGEANIQRNLGYGMCGSTIVADLFNTTNNVASGSCDSLGDACGQVSGSWSYNGVSGVNQGVPNLFGVEDAWGKVWEMTQGCYFGSTNNKALTNGKASQTKEDAYIYTGNALPADVTTVPSTDYYVLRRPNMEDFSRAYISDVHIHNGLLELIPSALGGSADNFFGDAYWSTSTGQLLSVGGTSNNGSSTGLGCVSSSFAWTNSAANIGSRLAYFGEATIVESYAELTAQN